jgi:hypothetical protein
MPATPPSHEGALALNRDDNYIAFPMTMMLVFARVQEVNALPI